jgi:hypothetical protein
MSRRPNVSKVFKKVPSTPIYLCLVDLSTVIGNTKYGAAEMYVCTCNNDKKSQMFLM